MEKEGAAKKGKNEIKQGQGEQEGIAGRKNGKGSPGGRTERDRREKG